MSTKTTELPLAEATSQQLINFATTACGLEIKAGSRKADVIGLIQTVWDKDYILVQADAEPEAVTPVVGAIPPAPTDLAKKQAAVTVMAQNSQNDRRCEILVAEGKGKDGKRPVPVAVNGVQILIPRGKKVVVAERYMEALNNAVRTEYEQDPNDHENMIATNVHSYPFQFLGFVDEKKAGAAA